MDGRRRVLTMYGQSSTHPPPRWGWVEGELQAAGTYWVTARPAGHPHPRPVWGVWHRDGLHLSIGSPVIAREIADDRRLAVHLESGTDVVIVEGVVPDASPSAAQVLEAYRDKYGSDYDVAVLGELTRVDPVTVMAWRTAGWAGKDGFTECAKWTFG
jgi:hypothetical protein